MTPIESKEQRAHPGRFGFDWRPRERDIICVVHPSLPKRGLLALWWRLGVSAFSEMRNAFLRMHPERTSTTRVHTSKPFTVWFLGALDGSDTSRTQVALADGVDRSRPCGAFDPPL